MTILVTGFEPFGASHTNPSQQLAEWADGQTIAGQQVIGATLPVIRYQAIERCQSVITKHQPAWVINLGVAANRNCFSPERVAINLDDFRIPDNAHNQPTDQPIFPDAPPAYFTSLPVKRIKHALANANIPCELSLSAGSYLCNHLFYGIRHQNPTMAAGFIHVPTEQVMPMTLQQQALQIVIQQVVNFSDDMSMVGGDIS